MHVGSDALYKAYEAENEAPLIISQILITLNAVLVVRIFCQQFLH
jgi:hypothetical protein